MGLVERRTLLFSIIEHCFAKNIIKEIGFLLKSNLLLPIIGGMQATFLSFNIVFSNDQ